MPGPELSASGLERGRSRVVTSPPHRVGRSPDLYTSRCRKGSRKDAGRLRKTRRAVILPEDPRIVISAPSGGAGLRQTWRVRVCPAHVPHPGVRWLRADLPEARPFGLATGLLRWSGAGG